MDDLAQRAERGDESVVPIARDSQLEDGLGLVRVVGSVVTLALPTSPPAAFVASSALVTPSATLTVRTVSEAVRMIERWSAAAFSAPAADLAPESYAVEVPAEAAA